MLSTGLRGMASTLSMRTTISPDGYAMLMSPIKGETAFHGCHCWGDVVVRMREVPGHTAELVRVLLSALDPVVRRTDKTFIAPLKMHF